MIPLVPKDGNNENIHGKLDMLQALELYRGAIIR